MNNKNIYIMKLLTNMHVGSGEINYNIVDKEVQRDVNTAFPTIHSSSLKGALREHFKSELGNESQELIHIFGDSNNMGQYKFFSGNILTMPVRSNKKYFFRAICPKIIDEFCKYLSYFDIESELKSVLQEFKELAENDKCVIFENIDNIYIETYDCIYKSFDKIEILQKLLGEDMTLLSDDAFNAISKELPVIARNHLENGESKNLWYEEVVPRESRFYFGVIAGEKYVDKFEKLLSKDMVQIGANCTIGYGYTRIKNLNNLVGDKDE